MKVIVDNKEAVLKKDYSFDYISENRLFLGRDGYSLGITFPMKDCPQNVAIFGRINRADVEKENMSFDCLLIDGAICLAGCLSVVKVSDTELEGQFAEGRCEQTALDMFDRTYINELDLGYYPRHLASGIKPVETWRSIDSGADSVALPWVNENYADVPNNWVTYTAGSGYLWHEDVEALSWQPYLIVIAKRICDAIGYAFDFSAWEASDYRHLIICNTLPAAWDKSNFAAALPHWSVSEFFQKLELLLECEFDFDYREKTVRFSFSADVLAAVPPVGLSDVVDEYTSEISQEDVNCDYLGAKRLAYKDCGHSKSNFYSCDWLLENTTVKEYDDVAAIIEENKRVDITVDAHGLKNTNMVLWGKKTYSKYGYSCNIGGLLYARKEKTYFAMRSIGTELLHKDNLGNDRYTQIYVLEPVNVFGSGSVEDESANTEEIEFCPVCIGDTYVDKTDDMGYMMYLSPSNLDDEDEQTDSDAREDESEIRQTPVVTAIEDGDSKDTSGAYDVIYVAFWDGANPIDGGSPYPIIDPVCVRQDWTVVRPHVPDLRLYNRVTARDYKLPVIDPAVKYNFSWLSSYIPNPRAIFYIRGRRYICEKISATFTEDGMSQLLKGEFYPLVDE